GPAEVPVRWDLELVLDGEVVDAGVGLERLRTGRNELLLTDQVARVPELGEPGDELLWCRPGHALRVRVVLVDDPGRVGPGQQLAHASDHGHLGPFDVHLNEVDAPDAVLFEDLGDRLCTHLDHAGRPPVGDVSPCPHGTEPHHARRVAHRDLD